MIRISVLDLPTSVRETMVYQDCNSRGALSNEDKNEYDRRFEQFVSCTLEYTLDDGWECVFTEDDYIWFALKWL